MSYNAIISLLREIARDQLRMEGVSNLRNKLFGFENAKGFCEKDILASEKDIAIAKYQSSKLEDANPEKEEVTKMYAKEIDACNETIANLKIQIEGLNKDIAVVNEKIAKWESGETKVNADEMEAIALDLVKFVTNETARGLAPILATAAESTKKSK